MTELSTPPIPRWRMITFWLLLVLLLVLYLGDRPEQLGFLVTAFGDLPPGEGATHEMHWFAQGVLAWMIVAAVAIQVRRPATQVGAAWVYGAALVLAFSLLLAFADLPAEVTPILMGALVVAALGFIAHPSAPRAKVTPVARPSLTLLAMTALAAVPWLSYALGQLQIHTGSGPHDEHFEFGHWVVMAIYALLIPVIGAVAAGKVSGWRFPLWAAGLLSVALGVGSLGITAVSQLSTGWAVAAIAWGVAFIGLGEREARRDRTVRPLAEVAE